MAEDELENDIPETGPLLEGVGVLVTRPRHQAASLSRMIEGEGGSAIRFPVLEIQDPEDSKNLTDAIESLEFYDWVIFVSVNAVNRGMEKILATRPWPDTVRIAVIGRRSAEELEMLGYPPDLVPEEHFNSEALLELPQMHAVQNQRIAIFRGNCGREFLARQLRARGADVEYVEAYRRICPDTDASGLLQRWQTGDIHIAVVNSAESLRNLEKMLGPKGEQLLKSTPLLVVSERMLPLVEQAGFQQPPVLAANATDAAVLDALQRWHREQVAGAGESTD